MTTKIKLSTITPVELRDCWQSESSDFTPWLAQEENMKLLAEAINIDELEVIAQEEYGSVAGRAAVRQEVSLYGVLPATT